MSTDAYFVADDQSTWKKGAGDSPDTMLSNFSAEIVEEIRYVDGRKTETELVIDGRQVNLNTDGEETEVDLPRVTIPAEKFAGLGWITPHWGVGAVVNPGQGIKDDLRTAIQLRSKSVRKTTIYTHTGWMKIKDKWTYLHNGGGLTEAGNNPNIKVELPPELQRYTLNNGDHSPDAIRASLALLKLGPPEVMWPLLAATFRSPIHSSDFAVHVAGRTGTFKSEVTSLFQAHYGPEMDARHLPCSWSSTANANEALCYRVKDATVTIDDFIPTGTSWQQKTYQKAADQLIRGQGNQSGRARLTDASRLQETMYPRGLIVSSGEDVPQGHSVRSRMLIVEIEPNTIDLPALTLAQRDRPLLSQSMSQFIRWLAKQLTNVRGILKDQAEKLRDDLLEIGHPRTPPMLGNLAAAARIFLSFAAESGAITEDAFKQLRAEASAAIIEVGRRQIQHLEDSDPTDVFFETLRNLVAAQKAHFRTREGGIPRDNPTRFGWIRITNPGSLDTFKAGGQLLGWLDPEKDELLLDAGVVYQSINRAAQGGQSLTKNTLFKRLKEAGHLVRVDDQRERNTVRVMCDGISRQCFCLSIVHTFQIVEEEETYGKDSIEETEF